MHPAAKLQFERIVDEFARWRAVPEDERPPAPAWWWGPAIELRDSTAIAAGRMVRRLGLPDGATYADGAEMLLERLAGQTSVPWPYDFSRKVEFPESDVRDLHPQPSDDSAFQPDSDGLGTRLRAAAAARRCRGSAAQQFGHLPGRQRLAEQKSLHFVAGVIAQERLLLDGLDALGNDRHPQRLAHADDGLGDGLILGIVGQVADEGTVDLDGVDRELLHQRHRRIAGAEIVDRKADAAALDRVEHPDRARHVAHHHAFGDLELQQHRRHAAGQQRLVDILQQMRRRRIAAATG